MNITHQDWRFAVAKKAASFCSTYCQIVPDKALNQRNKNARNKFTQKTLLRNDHVMTDLPAATNINSAFDF